MKFGLPDASDGPSEATGGMKSVPPVASEGPFQATGGMKSVPPVALDGPFQATGGMKSVPPVALEGTSQATGGMKSGRLDILAFMHLQHSQVIQESWIAPRSLPSSTSNIAK